jgi:hypothetical protein
MRRKVIACRNTAAPTLTFRIQARLIRFRRINSVKANSLLIYCDRISIDHPSYSRHSSARTGGEPANVIAAITSARLIPLRAMKPAGVKRLIVVTGLGAGDSRGHGVLSTIWLLSPCS